jgi:hypothetical protein
MRLAHIQPRLYLEQGEDFSALAETWEALKTNGIDPFSIMILSPGATVGTKSVGISEN